MSRKQLQSLPVKGLDESSSFRLRRGLNEALKLRAQVRRPRRVCFNPFHHERWLRHLDVDIVACSRSLDCSFQYYGFLP